MPTTMQRGANSPPTALAITLQAAVAADAGVLADLRVQAMRESLERVGRFDPQRARDRFLSTFVPECTRHILVEGVRVGFHVVRPDGAGWLLDHLCIHPEHQRRGLGKAVVSQILADADMQQVSVRVGALKHSDSNRFYERLGFVRVAESEFDNHYIRHARVPAARCAGDTR